LSNFFENAFVNLVNLREALLASGPRGEASALNLERVPLANASKWHQKTVARLIARLASAPEQAS
jgi:hypothetical protein